jgi:hypothetical protein
MCPIDSNGDRTQADILITNEGKQTGVIRAKDFAICGDVNEKTQAKFNIDAVDADTSVTINVPSISGTLSVTGAGAIQYAEPLTEATVTLSAAVSNLILEPAGTIAELEIELPVAVDGKKITISSTEIVSALVLTPAGDDIIANDVTALAAGVPVSLIALTGVWYRG